MTNDTGLFRIGKNDRGFYLEALRCFKVSRRTHEYYFVPIVYQGAAHLSPETIEYYSTYEAADSVLKIKETRPKFEK